MEFPMQNNVAKIGQSSLCDEVECGKGTCKANISYPLNYICECDSGWKRTRDDDNSDDAIKFLPCVIPNCTLDYSCQQAPPPVPANEVPHNSTFFDRSYLHRHLREASLGGRFDDVNGYGSMEIGYLKQIRPSAHQALVLQH
ncbi:hypothetical protein PTKIN_Ptkin06aG0191100 [Pterospermum kingtungense]